MELASPSERGAVTLGEAQRVRTAATPAARALIAYLLATLIGIPFALRFSGVDAVRAVLTWAGPLALVGALVLAWRLRRTSPVPADRRLLAAGSLALAATAAFDVIVTIVKDPGLQIEMNPFARMLLDSGSSLRFVKAYAVTCQALVVAMLCVLLWTVLAHVEPLRVLAWGLGPRNRKEFVAAATRGTTDTSQLYGLRPRDWSTMKAHSYAIWLASVLCIGSCLGRTAFALEWLGVRMPPAIRLVVIALGALLLLSAAWSRAWRKGRPLDGDLPTPDDATPVPATRRVLETGAHVAILAVVFLAFPFVAREVRKAAEVERALDGRIHDLEREVAEGRDAELRSEDLAAEAARLESEWSTGPASRALPCPMDDEARLASIRAVVEPLGVGIAGDDASLRRRRYDFYWELPVRVVLPDEPGTAAKVAAALARSERLVHLPRPHEEAKERVVLAYEWVCDEHAPELEDHAEPPWGRGALRWPFDRGVVRRERDIERLRAERDLHAGALLLQRRVRALTEDIPRRQAIMEVLARRASTSD